MSPCNTLDLGDDLGTFIVCGPRPRARKCHTCKAPALLLCDWPKSNGKTCDRPICDVHAVEAGPDVDYCHEHLEVTMPRNPTEPAACRSCGAAVYWVRTSKGKRMPVDVEPSAAGGFYLFKRPARGDVEAHLAAVHVQSSSPADELVIAGAVRRGQNRYTSHFQTCPSAAEHRRK